MAGALLAVVAIISTISMGACLFYKYGNSMGPRVASSAQAAPTHRAGAPRRVASLSPCLSPRSLASRHTPVRPLRTTVEPSDAASASTSEWELNDAAVRAGIAPMDAGIAPKV